MTTAQFLSAPEVETSLPDRPASTKDARISFRQPLTSDGFIDAAWWPRSRDLTTELPELLDLLWTAGREINRVNFSLSGWNPAPRQLFVDGRTVRLGGFVTGDPLAVRLSDSWGRERIDILAIPADTDPAVAERALRIASEPDSPYRASEILARAADPS